jgi:hydroxymethylpyrimidine pyrophosphatase-like HAD family hydrolase
MLTWAGRSVAVANAHPAVKAVATEHIGNHADDAVASYLDALA